MESYGKNLGLAFQIADDALDYHSVEKIFGKKVGTDFFEGKATLPIIILSQRANDAEKKKLSEIFKRRERDNLDLENILKLIKKYNVVDECFDRAKYFVNVSRDALSIFENSEEKRVLQGISFFSLNRKFWGTEFLKPIIFIFFIRSLS